MRYVLDCGSRESDGIWGWVVVDFGAGSGDGGGGGGGEGGGFGVLLE